MQRYMLVVILSFWTSMVSAQEIAWRMHALNAKAEFTSCAALDIDHDGDLDVYSGGWWYEAPDWKQHKVREVATIRGRFDDYSNQLQDCNGDGWLDVISVNYRSETIYWIEHPGKKLGQQDWTAHVIDKPGPSETGRLHDLDGDGDLDILPNGTSYAAWYEFAPEKQSDGTLSPKWLKRDLPAEAAGHGIGIARLNEQTIILANRGWLQPDAKEKHRWHFTPYTTKDDKAAATAKDELHAPPIDASIPILSLVVEKNPALNWIVVGSGHHQGVFAGTFGYEKDAKLPTMKLTPIDTTWSQCHAPLWADIDGDSRVDLVAGKRYLGHDGKDPGELDPLCIYWYKHDPAKQKWERHVIHEKGPAGLDLDAKCIDLDGDGDLDLIAPSRNGLYWFESLRINKKL